MILDFNPAQQTYILRVPRASADVLLREHGFNFSQPESRHDTAVLYTKDPFCAASFASYASPAAAAQLNWIGREIGASSALDSGRHLTLPPDKELMGFQRAGVDYILNRQHALDGDEPGLGKCQPLWAKVLTPQGWRQIGELRLGDNTCTAYGKMARVVGVYDRGVALVHKITFNDGAVAYGDTHHIWKVRGRSGTGEVEWFHAQTWELIERLALGQRVEVPLPEPHMGIEGKPPVNAYLVGLLLGDGCLRGGQISISSADPEIIARCKTIARYYGAEVVFKGRVDWRFRKIARLRELLSDLGIMGHLARTKRVPPRYIHANWRVRLDTLRGLMDSDGWCCTSGVNTGFGSTSEGLADDVISLVRSLGGIARKVTKPGSWSVTINMPTCPFWLPRKADLWKPYEHYKPARWIRSIVPHSTEPVRCISVASRDRLYITDDYVVTHNTPTSIAVANEMQAKRIIVVCPASIRGQWLRRIKEWSTIPDAFCYAVTSSRYGTSETAHWTVVSYELARNPAILRGLVKQRFDLLIVDEAHFAKDISSKRSRAIFGYHDGRVDDGESETEVVACLMDVCERTLTLTGTPSPNRPSELYVLCRALNWDSIDWLSEQRFRERYNPQSKGKTSSGKVWAHEEEGRLPELQNRLRSYIMCRHQMKDVRHQLKAAFPDPIYDLIYLEETRAIKLALEAERMLDIDPENLAGADFKILGAISTVRKQMGLAMAPQVAGYLQTLLVGGEHKLVIFTWHTEVTDYLVRALAQWQPLWTDGRNTGAKDRIVQEFIKNPQRDVLIGNILTLGTGTDEIQFIANHCLFAEPDWVPGNNDQCVKRLARVGQLSRVLADFFLVRDSMAEKVLATALRKGGTLHKTLDARVGDGVYAI